MSSSDTTEPRRTPAELQAEIDREQRQFAETLDALSEAARPGTIARRQLGKAMEEAWHIAPSRPHPISPDTPPGNWLSGIPAAGYDVLVGAVKAVKRKVLRR